ncbi:hypothetical protein K505DRAFT_366288 [Melanomma pulvis-pyrius CBS 109.77]|uniref:Uncharacterized protein n=1 Tax=Melanomma pulvis-pyrius CBS 109.77 TaxID=1314802 RepID=A0A6A6WXI7_9PLEO|nr:hypothetical protein K505DRAFT_366288 [Melanomma pulvis-pyrius CBS 109.77]
MAGVDTTDSEQDGFEQERPIQKEGMSAGFIEPHEMKVESVGCPSAAIPPPELPPSIRITGSLALMQQKSEVGAVQEGPDQPGHARVETWIGTEERPMGFSFIAFSQKPFSRLLAPQSSLEPDPIIPLSSRK